MWKRSLQNFEAEYPDPLQFGWESNLDISGHFPLIAVVTEELPVPEATLELTYCGLDANRQSAQQTDVAVIILIPLCVVVLNVLIVMARQ